MSSEHVSVRAGKSPGRSEGMWAITCYFNPAGYRRRLENYHLFRRFLSVPLVTVELSFTGSFELRPEDADVLVPIRGGDVMWQKERLLNIALRWIPNACQKIGWIDCDVVFDNGDWVERASRALDEVALVHLFSERFNLPRDVDSNQFRSRTLVPNSRSVVGKLTDGEATPEDLFRSDAPLERGSTAGLAWASRREVLERHGLYDACILGSGDRTILSAALGEFDCGSRATFMNDRRKEHYLAWAQPYFATVRGRVGHIPGRLFHLWHGDLKDRQYEGRHRGFESFDFDPFADITLDENSCWRWSSDKKEMHEFVRSYFESRNEDGAGSPALLL